MRRLYLSIGLVVLLALLSGLHVWHLDGFTAQLTGLLTQAQRHAEQEDWPGAALLTRQAKELWTGMRSRAPNTPPSTPGC